MKKVFKIIGTVAAICAGVAGGIFLYSKIKKRKSEELDEFEDYDDDFSDEDDIVTESETAEV